MVAIFPGKPLTPIPADDRLFTSEFGGYELSQVTRRRMSSDGEATANDPLRPLVPVEAVGPPELESITIDGRHAFIFSPLDLSCALEGAAIQCEGYKEADAARITLNALLYATH